MQCVFLDGLSYASWTETKRGIREEKEHPFPPSPKKKIAWREKKRSRQNKRVRVGGEGKASSVEGSRPSLSDTEGGHPWVDGDQRGAVEGRRCEGV